MSRRLNGSEAGAGAERPERASASQPARRSCAGGAGQGGSGGRLGGAKRTADGGGEREEGTARRALVPPAGGRGGVRDHGPEEGGVVGRVLGGCKGG